MKTQFLGGKLKGLKQPLYHQIFLKIRKYLHFFEMFPKTHEKTQNSSKILKKNSSQNSKKTQKPATPVEFNWC